MEKALSGFDECDEIRIPTDIKRMKNPGSL